MRCWLLRTAVAICALALAATGGWWVWRTFWSADRFRAAVERGIRTGDFTRAGQLVAWGADTVPWRKLDSGRQLLALLEEPPWRAAPAERSRKVKDALARAARVLAFGAEVDARNDLRHTPLALALGNTLCSTTEGGVIVGAASAAPGADDLPGLVRGLIEAGADPNAAFRRVPVLVIAASAGYEPIARVLLEAGARANAKAGTYLAVSPREADTGYPLFPDLVTPGGTALHGAAARNDVSTARLLLGHGVKADAADEKGRAPLHLAAAYGAAGAARLLISEDVPFGVRDGEGATPLHLAAGSFAADAAAEDTARAFVAAGADVNARTPQGVTPLHCAALADRGRVIELLAATGADVNAKTTAPAAVFRRAPPAETPRMKWIKAGWTPLHLGAEAPRPRVVRALLRAGARPDVKDRGGITPLDIAKKRGHTEIIRLLEAAEKKR